MKIFLLKEKRYLAVHSILSQFKIYQDGAENATNVAKCVVLARVMHPTEKIVVERIAHHKECFVRWAYAKGRQLQRSM